MLAELFIDPTAANAVRTAFALGVAAGFAVGATASALLSRWSAGPGPGEEPPGAYATTFRIANPDRDR